MREEQGAGLNYLVDLRCIEAPLAAASMLEKIKQNKVRPRSSATVMRQSSISQKSDEASHRPEHGDLFLITIGGRPRLTQTHVNRNLQVRSLALYPVELGAAGTTCLSTRSRSIARTAE